MSARHIDPGASVGVSTPRHPITGEPVTYEEWLKERDPRVLAMAHDWDVERLDGGHLRFRKQTRIVEANSAGRTFISGTILSDEHPDVAVCSSPKQIRAALTGTLCTCDVPRGETFYALGEDVPPTPEGCAIPINEIVRENGRITGLRVKHIDTGRRCHEESCALRTV